MQNLSIYLATLLFLGTMACQNRSNQQEKDKATNDTIQQADTTQKTIREKLNQYVEVKLEADLSKLNNNQRQVLRKMIKAAQAMDGVFWHQAYGTSDSLKTQTDGKAEWRYAQINYGPWDRLADNASFVEGIGPKPAGANFYPPDMSKKAFNQAELPHKNSLYTMLRRNEEGKLKTVWYHEAFKAQHEQAAELLKQASAITRNPSQAEYLNLRAVALLSDQYKSSIRAWMELENNMFNLIIGPIETYEDQLFGYKASNEGMVLIKDQEWSQRLARYAQYLPELQAGLPVPEKFKQEQPGRDAELNAYQIVYYAGGANAGPKTIAKNLPNNADIQNEKGSRRMQLKNAMRAKFDTILEPISRVLIDEEQRSYITFKAFFGCTMFHEVAHGLGLNNTINDKGTVRKALQEHASAIEEGKADILGIHMITELLKQDRLEGNLKDYYTTFMASIFRSVRFGASSAHGKANMIRFNYFKNKGAFKRQENGTYKINYDKMREAIKRLSRKILTIQGKGDYQAAQALVNEQGVIQAQLQKDLNKLDKQGIPVDITFKQGIDVLGLNASGDA